MSFCLIFFISLFNEGQLEKMPIGIVDHDNSKISRQFVRNLDATQQAKVVMQLSSYQEARTEMQKGNIYAFVEIESGFAEKLQANRRPPLTFYINDAYLTAGSLLLKDMQSRYTVKVGNDYYVRGSRSGGMAYYIDGGKVMGSPDIPLCGLDNYRMYSGHVPAKYGDALGGIVVIETRNYFSEWQ